MANRYRSFSTQPSRSADVFSASGRIDRILCCRIVCVQATKSKQSTTYKLAVKNKGSFKKYNKYKKQPSDYTECQLCVYLGFSTANSHKILCYINKYGSHQIVISKIFFQKLSVNLVSAFRTGTFSAAYSESNFNSKQNQFFLYEKSICFNLPFTATKTTIFSSFVNRQQHFLSYKRNKLLGTNKMPLSSAATNGHFNGCNGKTTDSYDMEDGQTFLFTSESVGEGHPGKYYF